MVDRPTILYGATLMAGPTVEIIFAAAKPKFKSSKRDYRSSTNRNEKKKYKTGGNGAWKCIAVIGIFTHADICDVGNGHFVVHRSA